MSDTFQGPGWWIASDSKWYPPQLHPSRIAGVSRSPAFAPVRPAVGDPASPGAQPRAAREREAGELAARSVSNQRVQMWVPFRPQGRTLLFLAIPLALVAGFLGGLLGWQLTSNSAARAPAVGSSGPVGTGTSASAAQMAALRSAVAKTAGASGYTASTNVSLELGRATLGTVKGKLIFQAPDRLFVSEAQLGHTSTATFIGRHCWISDGSVGAGACDTGADFNGRGLLTVLNTLGRARISGTAYSFVPTNTSATLAAMGVSFEPFGGSAAGRISSTVSVTIDDGYIQSEHITVLQRSSTDRTVLSGGRFVLTYSHIGSSPPVVQPSGPPTGTIS
jgi:hypothetical protein